MGKRLQKENRRFPVYFFGDSICFGQHASPHLTWVTRLSARLGDMTSAHDPRVVVQNPSVNGNTTQDALHRIAYDVEQHEPEVVYVQFGMNDCNYWETAAGKPRVPPMEYESNLNTIIERLIASGVQAVILATNHQTLRNLTSMPHTGLTYEESNRAYNEITRRVSRGAPDSVTLVDIEESFRTRFAANPAGHEKALLPDGLHLSGIGNDVYLETVFPVVAAIVNELLDGSHS